VLNDQSASFSQRLLRVRAQNHRYRLGAARCSKSNTHGNLREATYAECDRLESCSKDPIGYEGNSASLYRFIDSSPLDSMDPTGEIRVFQIRPTNLRPKCDAPSAVATFKFELNRWPCRGNLGYFVQKVRVHCHIAKCSPPAPPNDGGASDHFVYFEAWPVVRPLLGKAAVLDTAKALSSGRGRYRQDGTVKFYCLSPDNQTKEGEISTSETSAPGPGVFGVGGPCPTESGGLHSMSTEPLFWSRAAAATSGHRTFGMNWNCCCGKLKFADAFARP
jgi:hypothetical protein